MHRAADAVPHEFAHDAEAVAGLTHVQQDQRILVGHKLWGHDARVRAKRRFDHQLHGVGLETHVIVTEEEER